MIVSFKDADIESLANGQRVKRFINIEWVAQRKLRLEALAGDRTGQFSIRINDQFRICFRWTSAGAADVEIVDYH